MTLSKLSSREVSQGFSNLLLKVVEVLVSDLSNERTKTVWRSPVLSSGTVDTTSILVSSRFVIFGSS